MNRCEQGHVTGAEDVGQIETTGGCWELVSAWFGMPLGSLPVLPFPETA